MLRRAVSTRDVDKAKKQLAAGADVNASSEQGVTALISAAYHGLVNIVEELLKHKSVDVDRKDKSNRTALSHAAERGHAKVVQLLLDAEADVNAEDDQGRTPLLAAALSGQTQVIEVLTTAARPKLGATVDGKTALDWSVELGDAAAVSRLLNAYLDQDVLVSTKYRSKIDGRNALMVTSHSGVHQKAFNKAVTENENCLTDTDNKGRNVLYHVTGHMCLECATSLLEHVRDDGKMEFVSLVTRGGKSALSLVASEFGKVAVTEDRAVELRNIASVLLMSGGYDVRKIKDREVR